MGTGIVSVALALDHRQALSRIWLGFAAAAWLLLAVVIVTRLAWNRGPLRAEADSPAGLTGVAASAVLGSRLAMSGLRAEAIALLIVASAMWLVLSGALLRRRWIPRAGSSFMLTVSVQSLAVLAVLISSRETAWLTYAGLAAFVLGLALYPLVLARFDPRELRGGAGDQWVAGGALAISALCAGEIGLAAARTGTLHPALPALHTASVVIWSASVLWIPALVACELVAPRLRYDVRRWATVFPVGMYAASSFQTARVGHLPLARSVAGAGTWVAVAVWLIVFAGMTGRAVRTAEAIRPGGHSGGPPIG
jgi:tellurite resistance protein TehA-like permease